MSDGPDSDYVAPVSGDDLLRMLSALSNPHRLRVLAALTRERIHVSQLARELGIGRPLLHLHLRRLEEAGLVRGSLEVSQDGKAMKFYEVLPFRVALTPATITAAVATLASGTSDESAAEERGERKQ